MAEKKAMTEEQKAKMAEGRKKAAEKKAAEAEAKKTEKETDPRDEMIAELERKLEEMAKMQQALQIVQVSPSTEKVFFQWMAEVADDNVVEFGPNGMYGRIVGKTGSFYVPKDDLSRVLDSMNRYFLDQRWLIILSGLTDEEREVYGVKYEEGEILDRQAFAKLINLGDEILDIYPMLCKGHKTMVAKRFYEAWSRNNNSIKRDVVVKLNEMSKEAGSEHGDFTRIIEEMNAKQVN